MTRSEWLKAEIKNIQAGGVVQMRCVMSTPERVEQGLCLGVLPQHRINRRQDTCSPECQEDKRRVKREVGALRTCRICGHGLTKTQREKLIRKGTHGPRIDHPADSTPNPEA